LGGTYDSKVLKLTALPPALKRSVVKYRRQIDQMDKVAPSMRRHANAFHTGPPRQEMFPLQCAGQTVVQGIAKDSKGAVIDDNRYDAPKLVEE
jgi:hypothetical protein